MQSTAKYHDTHGFGEDSLSRFHRWLDSQHKHTLILFHQMVAPDSIWFGKTSQYAVVDDFGTLVKVAA